MAKLGTPENPEVIEPGHRRPIQGPEPLARLSTAIKLFKALLLVVTPAVLLDLGLINLFTHGVRDQSAIAFLLGVLLSPLAVVASVLALVAGPILALSFVLALAGRAPAINLRTLGRFG